jgi:hypothetical protein
MRIMNVADIVEENGKTIRENNLARNHKYKVGDLVEVKLHENYDDFGACIKFHARLWIVNCGRDCDGTPLYSLSPTPRHKWDSVSVEVKFDGDEWCRIKESVSQNIFYKVLGGIPEECLTLVTEKLPSLMWEEEENVSSN